MTWKIYSTAGQVGTVNFIDRYLDWKKNKLYNRYIFKMGMRPQGGMDMANMLDYIKKLPEELEEAAGFDVPQIDFSSVKNIIFAGMGGSAISGDLARLYLADLPVPMESVRGYELPAYINEHSLVFVSSYSGNTEETLSCYEFARDRGASVIAISSDGKLEEATSRDSVPFVKIPGGLPPRAALGWLFVPIIKVFETSGVVDGRLDEIKKTAETLFRLRDEFSEPDSAPFEMAGRFYKRIPLIYTSRRLAPVGLRWKAQINENAKAFAHFMELPEMNHNEIAGIKHPEELVEEMWALFITDRDDHKRIKMRMKHTSELIDDSVLGSEFLESKGDTLIERVFYLIYFGDFLSYYLATMYMEDAVNIERISKLKERMSKS